MPKRSLTNAKRRSEADHHANANMPLNRRIAPSNPQCLKAANTTSVSPLVENRWAPAASNSRRNSR